MQEHESEEALNQEMTAALQQNKEGMKLPPAQCRPELGYKSDDEWLAEYISKKRQNEDKKPNDK